MLLRLYLLAVWFQNRIVPGVEEFGKDIIIGWFFGKKLGFLAH